MLYETAGQGLVFAVMCAAGGLIGLWYALCRRLRRVLEAGVLLSLLADCAFGVGAAALLALGAVAADNGRLRPYMLLAAGLGWALCAGGPLPLLRRLLCALRKIGKQLSENRITKVIFR